uniref:Uncharacterized protein n=1 Tax=viral metagenome TaxID=1070528 RepID=A0A6C0DNV4_9ZZZZ
MFRAIWGSLLFLFGLVIVGYTIYTMTVNTPTTTVGWVFQSFYLLGGLIVTYYGYRTLYPPPPPLMTIGGRRRY